MCVCVCVCVCVCIQEGSLRACTNWSRASSHGRLSYMCVCVCVCIQEGSLRACTNWSRASSHGRLSYKRKSKKLRRAASCLSLRPDLIWNSRMSQARMCYSYMRPLATRI